MARHGDDAKDQIRGTEEDDYTEDPPEFRRETETPQDETEKRPLFARALERIQKTADGFRSMIASGFEALNRRTQKDGVQPPEPLDPNGFLNQVEEAQDMFGTIIEEINDGAHADGEIARLKAAQAQRELEEEYAQNVEGPVKRFISWLASGEEPAATRGPEQQEQETQTDDEDVGVARVDQAQTQGAPLSRLGELAKRVFGKQAETGEGGENTGVQLPAAEVASDVENTETKERLLTEAEIRVEAELDAMKKRVDPLTARIDSALASNDYPKKEAASALGNTLSREHQKFQEGVRFVHIQLRYAIEKKTKPLAAAESDFNTNIQFNVDQLNKRLEVFESRFATIDQEALSSNIHGLKEQYDRVQTKLGGLSESEKEALLSRPTGTGVEVVAHIVAGLEHSMESADNELSSGHPNLATMRESVLHLKRNLPELESAIDAVVGAREAAPVLGVEALSDSERVRLEQGVKDADFLIGVFETVDDRYTLALTELNRLSDPTLKSNIKHDLDLNLDRLIGMRNAVRNARDVLNDELSGRKKGGDAAKALSVVNEHNASGSDFYTRRTNFYRAVSALEDALSAQDRAAVPAAEVSAEASTDAPPAAEVSAPALEASSLPLDVQKNLDAARFVLKHATDTDDAYLKRIKDSRGSANKLSEDERSAIQNFQIACSGIRDALNNAEAILKGDTFHGDRQKLNERVADAYASLDKLKTIADLAGDLADAAYQLEQNLPSTIEPVLAAARAKAEQEAQEQLREAITDATDKAVRGYNDLNRRIPREFDNLAVLDKDAPPGITVVQALSEIHDQITYAQGEAAKGDLLGAQATLKVVNEAWIQPLNAVIDDEIAAAQKVRAEAAEAKVPPTEIPTPAEAALSASGDTEVPMGLDESATAHGTGIDTELPLNPVDSLKKSARELVNDKLNILSSNLDTLSRSSLTEEQRDWASEQYGKLGVKAEKIRTAAEALLANEELRGKVESGDEATTKAFLKTLETALDTLIAEFPMTQESVAAAMAAEAATPVPGAGAGRPSSAEIQTPGAPSGAGETGKPSTAELIENQKDAAQEFVESELREPLRKVFTPLYAEPSLTDDERKWILNKYNATFTRSGELLTQHATDLAAAKSPAQQGAAFSKVTLEGPRLVREFPKTKEELRAAMVAEAAASVAPAKGPETSVNAGAETENPIITAEKNRLATRLQINRDGVLAIAKQLEGRCASNPELKSRLDRLNTQITLDLENVGKDIAKCKMDKDIVDAEHRIGEAYDNLIDALATLTELAGVTQLSLEAQKKMTALEIENATLKSDVVDLKAQMQELVDAQASGGAPSTPGGGGPGAPGGPTGPGGGPTPPPGGGGPAGPGGPKPPEPPPVPEPGTPEDPEKAQAEAIKTELETTLIPEIQTALAGRDYLLDISVRLPVKHPENPGVIIASTIILKGHIDDVSAAPAGINQKIESGTMLEALQDAQNAKFYAEAIIEFLQGPLPSDVQDQVVEIARDTIQAHRETYNNHVEAFNDIRNLRGLDIEPLSDRIDAASQTLDTLETLLDEDPVDAPAISENYQRLVNELRDIVAARHEAEIAAIDIRRGTVGGEGLRGAANRAIDTFAVGVAAAPERAVRAVAEAGPRAARAVGRADRAWGRRIERGLDRSGRADSFEDRARRFFHGLGERFRSNLADRLGLGFNSAIIRFHERGVEDIALRTDALREEINNPEDGLVVLIAESRRILDPSNPDELPPGEIATERREYNRLVRELGARQRDLDRDLGTLERRRAAAQPYFDARQNIATDAKLRLEQYTGERAARYDAARKRSGQIRGELSAAESDRDQLSAEIQTVRLSLHTERRALRAGLRRQITRMESQLRSMNREIGPQRRVLATVNNDIASLAPHVTYWRDQVLPEFTRFSREPVPVNHGNFGPREVPGLDTTRHSTRPAPTTPDSFTGAPIAGGGGGGGTPEAPAPAAAGGEQGRTGVEAGDENIRISPRDIAEALFRKWGSQIGVASADGMATEMQNFITAPQRFATGLDQKFELSQLRDFITEFNQHLNAAHFNKVDLRTLRTLTRDLRSRAGAENRAA